MSTDTPEDDYGELTEPTTLTIRRFLPGPIERVWAYLTESELRGKWLASGDMKLENGAPFTLTWRNSEFTDPPEPVPPGFSAEHSMASRITDIDPPNSISFAWFEHGNVTFQLEPRGERVLLTVTHRGVPSRDVLLKVSPGWHAHLDVLVARLTGRKPPPFWASWQRLREQYTERFAV